MKKSILMLLMSTITLFGYSQIKKVIPQKEVSLIKNGTVMIILKENDIFSDALKKTVEKNWTFSKYEFTTLEELQSKHKEKEVLPIFGFFDGMYNLTASDGSVKTYHPSCIGLTRKFRTKTYYDIRGKGVVDFYTFSKDSAASLHSIEADLTLITQQINNYLSIRENIENKVKSRASFFRYVNKQDIEDIKKKTMLISKEDLNRKFNTSDIKFKHQIVKNNRINDAILNKEDVLIYYLNGTTHNIISAKDGRLLHYYLASILQRESKAQSQIFKDFRKR
jgi:hypothetical protein